MKALKDFFNKNHTSNEAHKALVKSDAESFAWRLQSELKTWELSSDKAKKEYIETTTYLTENVPEFYKDVSFDYFKKCIIVLNIDYSTRGGSALPEPSEYESFFSLNYYGNLLPMFRPILSEMKRNAFKHIGGGMYQESYYPFNAMNEFVKSNWDTFLGREYEYGGRKYSYSPEKEIKHNVRFVQMKYLLKIVLSDSWITAEQCIEIMEEGK
jgi:hypothetical protein